MGFVFCYLRQGADYGVFTLTVPLSSLQYSDRVGPVQTESDFSLFCLRVIICRFSFTVSPPFEIGMM